VILGITQVFYRESQKNYGKIIKLVKYYAVVIYDYTIKSESIELVWSRRCGSRRSGSGSEDGGV